MKNPTYGHAIFQMDMAEMLKTATPHTKRIIAREAQLAAHEASQAAMFYLINGTEFPNLVRYCQARAQDRCAAARMALESLH
jgi:hypothetical protein